jgi:acyl dehydratase
MRWAAPFDELQLGDEFVTGSRTITEADVVAFATLTGDRHPQHIDADWAASSAFGERIAHGMLVVSFAVGLARLVPERVLALRRLREVVFKRPVALGDTITLIGSVSELRPVSEEAGLVQCTWSIVNQREELCVRAQVEVLWRRDAVSTAVA